MNDDDIDDNDDENDEAEAEAEDTTLDPLILEVPENGDAIEAWLLHLLSSKFLSDRTLELYRERINPLTTFAHFKKSDKRLLEMSRADIRDYFNYLRENLKLRPNTIKGYRTAAKSFYKWASEEAKLIKVSPMLKMQVNAGKKQPGKIFVPHAKEIIAFRDWWNENLIFRGHQVPNLPNALQNILIYELSLSSGMRISEVLQLRASDLKFNFKPEVYDIETNLPSVYVGGCIDIKEDLFVAKTTSSYQRVYFSVLAARLAVLYMSYHNITGLNIPLFPLERNLVTSIIGRAWNHYKASIGESLTPKTLPSKRSTLMEDVNLDDVNISQQLRKQIERKKLKAQQKKQALTSSTKNTVDERPKKLTPHTLRHFYGCLMYYRSWFGKRHDMLGTRDLMRHAQFLQSEAYITSTGLVDNDVQWKQIMVGNARTYWRIIIPFTQLMNQKNRENKQGEAGK